MLWEKNNHLLHWAHIYFWGQDTVRNPTFRALRGSLSARHRNYYKVSKQHVQIGFRPVLEPLNPDTLEPDSTRISHIADGRVLCLGTLYMDDNALEIPCNPTWTGDIPDYISGAQLRIGDTVSGKEIKFIKCGGILFSDRCLLKNISWNVLNEQGLVFGERITPNGKAHCADTIIVHQDGKTQGEGQLQEWELPVTWEVCGTVKIRAASLEDAVEQFRKTFEDIPLPKGQYVDSSLRLTSEDPDELSVMVAHRPIRSEKNTDLPAR